MEGEGGECTLKTLILPHHTHTHTRTPLHSFPHSCLPPNPPPACLWFRTLHEPVWIVALGTALCNHHEVANLKAAVHAHALSTATFPIALLHCTTTTISSSSTIVRGGSSSSSTARVCGGSKCWDFAAVAVCNAAQRAGAKGREWWD